MAAPGGESSTGGGPEIVGGPRTHQQQAAQRRLQQTQAQVDEVVDIMRTNVEKVLERDQKLSELDDRADALQQGASQFEQQAGKLKRKYWWKNLKMMIIMGVIGLIIIIIIGISVGTGGGGGGGGSDSKPTEGPKAASLVAPDTQPQALPLRMDLTNFVSGSRTVLDNPDPPRFQ